MALTWVSLDGGMGNAGYDPCAEGRVAISTPENNRILMFTLGIAQSTLVDDEPEH